MDVEGPSFLGLGCLCSVRCRSGLDISQGVLPYGRFISAVAQSIYYSFSPLSLLCLLCKYNTIRLLSLFVSLSPPLPLSFSLSPILFLLFSCSFILIPPTPFSQRERKRERERYKEREQPVSAGQCSKVLHCTALSCTVQYSRCCARDGLVV